MIEPYPFETNPITPEIKALRLTIEDEVDLTDPELKKITRLRLISDAGFPLWDLSYCYGELKDGTPVRVHLPQWQFSKKNLKGELIAMAKEAKVFAKGLGLLDDSVISKLT
jgi:hypothetical protein